MKGWLDLSDRISSQLDEFLVIVVYKVKNARISLIILAAIIKEQSLW